MIIRCLLAAVLLAGPAVAQQSLTLAAAIETALRVHPLLAAAGGRTAAAEALRLQAGLRPIPTLSLQAENLRPSAGETFQLSNQLEAFAFVTRPIELGGKRPRRIELAEANHRRFELERELAARQITARVRHAYWNAIGGQRVHDLLRESIQAFQQVIDYHVARVREGAMAEADLLRVRIEGERFALAANSASLDAERAKIQLFQSMGLTEFPSARLSEPLNLAEAPLADVQRALAERIEVRIARQAREAALANARLQRAIATPDMSAFAGYKRVSGYNAMMGGIAFGLPIGNRNQGNIAAAEAEVRVADSELAAAEALVAAEVRAAETDVRIRRQQLLELLQGMLDRATESSRIAQAAYREGGWDLLRLLDAERLRIEVQTLYVRTLAEYRQSVVSLETAMGVAP